MVSEYISIHSSLHGKEEVRWQSQNGEHRSLKYRTKKILSVGPTCPYAKSGYNECNIIFDSSGSIVQSLMGPGEKVYKRI